MTVVDLDALRARLGAIVDPELRASLAELSMLEEVRIEDTRVLVRIALTTLACPQRARFRDQIRAVVAELAPRLELSVEEVQMDGATKRAAMDAARRAAQRRAAVPDDLASTWVLAVGSGKGGVGKSTLAHGLARAMAASGHRVGLLDADIWGFSQPHLAGERGRLEATGTAEAWRIEPLRRALGAGELAVVSMGLLVEDPQDAILWRGPQLARAFEHFVRDVAWGSPDVLVIDLPPGTGDVPLTLARLLPDAKLLLATTPSRLAAEVAERAGTFARRANLELLGVVETMSSIVCPHGELLHPFGEEGGTWLAQRLGVPLLARLPFGDTTRELDEIATTLLADARHELDTCSARLWAAARSSDRPSAGA